MVTYNPFNDQYWIPRGSNKLLTYIGPPLQSNLDQSQLKEFLSRRSALGAIWNYDDDYSDHGPWYRTVCEKSDYEVAMIQSKNTRKKINKCLNNCRLAPIELTFMMENAYGVYLQACTRYKNADTIPEETFKADLTAKSQKHNMKLFGVFHEDKLIAYMTVLDFEHYAMGDIAAFDPAFSNYYPMYGLYYYVAHYFVTERGYKEFDRGSKPLMHETEIDEFLEKMEYRKKYCRLGFYLSTPAKISLQIAGIFRFVLPNKIKKIIDSLNYAQKISSETMNQQ